MIVNIHNSKPRYNYQFTVNDSGIIGVYGISGGGKSSLLNALAGFDDSVEGVIEFQSKKILNTQNKQKVRVIKCSYMNQHPILFPHWTVQQNLEFAQKYSNKNTQLSTELINLLDCQNLLDKKPEQLSGGEKQRIAYIRALIQIENNHLVLLDEPYSALDPNIRKAALKLLLKYNNDCLIFLVTHEISELYQVADELLYIENGQISYQNQINVAMSSQFKSLPLASKIFFDKNYHVIYADDVSIGIKENQSSSIRHQIPVIITEITQVESFIIVKLKMLDQETSAIESSEIENSKIENPESKTQYIYSKITKKSLDFLELETNQKVYANFKGMAFQDLL